MGYQAENALIEHANGQEAEQAEVVQPQNFEDAPGLGRDNAEPVQPQSTQEAAKDKPDAAEMTDEEFSEYIESAKNGEVQAANGVAADDQEENRAENPAENLQNEEKPEPYMQFATEEELQAYQDKTIGNRLRELREQYAPAKEKLEQVFSVVKDFYAIEDQEEALKTLLADLQAQSAEKKGMPVEEMIRQQEMERDALAYRNQQKAEREQQKAVSKIYTDWERQAEHLRGILPDFDLNNAFQNPEFYQKVVEGGYSLSEAYMAVERSKPSPQQKTAARRPIQEAGAQNTAVAGKIRQDVGTMTDGEFLSYIRRIQNG